MSGSLAGLEWSAVKARFDCLNTEVAWADAVACLEAIESGALKGAAARAERERERH